GKKHAVAALINLAQMPFISSQLQAAYNKAMPGAEMVEKWAKGTIAITNDLEGLTCTTSYSGFDENGKAIVIDPEKYGMTMKNIDADFLQYLTNDDVFVVAGGIPADYPWESILDAVSEQAGPQAAQVKMALPYLQALEGTFAIAAGPRNGIASFNSNAVNDNWSGVLYISLKEGKAAEFMGQIKMIVSQMMPDALVASDDDNLAVNLEGVTVYLGVRGNNLIASLQEIKGGGTASVFKASEFEGKSGIALLRLAKDSRLCTELGMPFGVFSKMCQSSDNAAEWLIEETSTEGKFLENIINYAVSLSGK
ncbi:MAG: hypothetical protein K2O12_04140, partial [Muribaculaceae bacterium]|nr:hypothetical protein [Muribaculaceae bacterium]